MLSCLVMSKSSEKAMTPHSSTLAWKIPWMEEPDGLQSMELQRVRHDWAISLSCIGEGNGNPLQCSCLENPRDGGAWWAAVYGVAQSRTRLKWLSSRLVITFLPRSKRLLISWLQSPSAVILEPPKIKSDTISTVSSSISHEVMGPDAMIFVFWMLSFKPTFSLSFFTFIKRLFSFSSLSAIRWCHLHIWGYWYLSRQSWFQLVLLPAQHFSWCTLHIS